jgi:hypothetical protein
MDMSNVNVEEGFLPNSLRSFFLITELILSLCALFPIVIPML